MKNANVLNESVAEEPLAVHPVGHCTGHDSVTALPVATLLPKPWTCTLAIEAVVRGDGSHVKDASLPSEHAATELQAVRCQHARWPQTAWSPGMDPL